MVDNSMMLKKSLQDPDTQKPSQNSGNLQVALMDAYIPDHAPPVWGELEALLQLDLHIFTSYRTLNRWVRVQHAGCVIQTDFHLKMTVCVIQK